VPLRRQTVRIYRSCESADSPLLCQSLMDLAAKGQLPPYPPQEKTGWLVFGAKPKTKFSLHPWGFLPASFFGVKSKHPVYWT